MYKLKGHIFVGLCLGFFVSKVCGVCDSSTQHTCANTGVCIPLAYQNDGINDCGDNSEEGDPFTCVRKDDFKCTKAGPLGVVCYSQTWVNDGHEDCPDKSDELKRRIGARCETNTNGVFQPYCSDSTLGIGPGGECDTTNRTGNYRTCQCQLGWIANARRIACSRRKLYDKCSIPGDCSAAVPGTTCVGNICVCDTQWFPGPDNATCVERKLNDPCTEQPQCTTKIPYSYCDGKVCSCTYGLIASFDLLSCIEAELPSTKSSTPKPSTPISTQTTPQPTSTTTAPANVTDGPLGGLDVYAIAGIVAATVVVAALVGAAGIFLLVLVIFYSVNKESSMKEKRKDMATNLHFSELEYMLPRAGVLAPLASQLAAIHTINEIIQGFGDPNHITPNATPNFSPNVSETGSTPQFQAEEANNASKYVIQDADVADFDDTVGLLGAAVGLAGLTPVATDGVIYEPGGKGKGKAKGKKKKGKKAKKAKKK